MHPTFGFNQPGKKFNDNNAFNRGSEQYQNFVPNMMNMQNQEQNAFYNFSNQYQEEQNDNIQIPHHIKLLFDSEDKQNFENKGQRVNPGAQNNPAAGRQRDDVRQMLPNQMNYATMMQLQNFNTLMNQSNQNNDFSRGGAPARDLDTSNLSNRDSMNPSLTNVSRDSSRANLNTSKRNTSSRANVKDKNYQVSINEDISLIERIEVWLNQITMNHNKVCPFCSKIIDIKKCNFQNISAFMSNTSRKYYLTHFDCYLKSNNSQAATQLIPLSGIVEARINSTNALASLDMNNFLRSDRKAYFVSMEGYHPLSSYLLFKIDKLCYGLEHATYRNHLLYVNLSNTNTSLFEPNTYAIPFAEFRVIITVHTSHSNEDPYCYEFLVDFSQTKVSAEQKTKPVEVFYLHGENNIVMGTQVIFDANSELSSHLNYMTNLDTSFQSTGSTTSAKPDFGKNVFIVLKYFSVSLPLKRVEKRGKEATPTQQEEPTATPIQQIQQIQQQKNAPPKKGGRLQLNPNAPLFSNAQGQEFEPPQPFYPGGGQFKPNQANAYQNNQQQQQQQQPKPPGNTYNPYLQQNQMGGNQFVDRNEGQGMQNNQNMYFQQQNYGQNFQMEQQNLNRISQSPQQEHNFPPGFHPGMLQNMIKPPGLMTGNPNQQQMNQQFHPQGPQGGYQNQNVYNEVSPQKKQLHVDTKNLKHTNFPGGTVIGFEDLVPKIDFQEIPFTPERVQDDLKSGPDVERGRIKNANLYAAVLSGQKRESSNSKSPSLTKIQNKYFSGFSTPRSDNTFTPPQSNTPLRRLTPTGSHADLPGDDSGDQQWTEDMIENFKLDNYLDNLVEFAKTYNGSRVLQKFFPRANQNDIDAVISKIQDNIEELMLDPYANYMFQTLAQSCSSEQRYQLLQKIAPSMVKIACDKKGTHSLQAIVSLISRDVEEKLIKETLNGHVLDLTLDPQGTHLIQKLIVATSLNNIGFMYEPVLSKFIEVSNNSFGLCVLKNLMTKVEKSDQMRDNIINLLHHNLEELIQNPYGNYAVQHALDTYPHYCDKILDKILDKIIQYSNQKFSSNVIERCLVLTTPEYKKRFVQEILKNDRIVELMKNKYGNFVILKILQTADPEDKTLVMQSLLKNVNAVNTTKYKTRWIQFLEENPMKVPGFNTSQPVKPSLFKHAPHHGHTHSHSNISDDNLSRDSDDAGWNDDWSGPGQQQDQKKKMQQKNIKDRSQFFYNSKPNMGNYPGEYEDDRFGFGMMPQMDNVQGNYTNSPGLRGQNPAYNNPDKHNSNNKNKHPHHNQKQYMDKPGNMNKQWGYNNFY